ncbi:MAG: SDR family NAD(P)-dependent oxidoreductase [Chloroflexi bacterium]|nr:SDR family NAD(P)-dependent oxidoreductase [Chloroflexota bacterium]
MDLKLRDKVAIVTGSGRGIGRAEAIALAAEGAKVVVNGVTRTPELGHELAPVDETVAEIKKKGGIAIANYDSVATAVGGEAIVKAAVDNFGRLDILVNNAAIVRDRMVFNMTEEDWDSVMKVNLYGHFFTTKNACVLFKQQRSGRIINTSSQAGLREGTVLGQANYSAAKEGIIGFTRQVAREMGPYGVTCNAIRPSAGTRLNLNDEMRRAWEKAGKLDLIKTVEAMKTEDVAAFVVWLASDNAANVNGRTFYVQTGRIALYSEPIEEKTLVGWSTIDDLFKFMPVTLAAGLVNPVPPQNH